MPQLFSLAEASPGLHLSGRRLDRRSLNNFTERVVATPHLATAVAQRQLLAHWLSVSSKQKLLMPVPWSVPVQPSCCVQDFVAKVAYAFAY